MIFDCKPPLIPISLEYMINPHSYFPSQTFVELLPSILQKMWDGHPVSTFYSSFYSIPGSVVPENQADSCSDIV